MLSMLIIKTFSLTRSMEKDFFTKNQETFTSNQMAAKCAKACHRPFRFNDVVFLLHSPTNSLLFTWQ